MRLVCQVVVKMLTKPKQGFCAKVIDHYGSLAGSVPKFLVKVTIDCTVELQVETEEAKRRQGQGCQASLFHQRRRTCCQEGATEISHP